VIFFEVGYDKKKKNPRQYIYSHNNLEIPRQYLYLQKQPGNTMTTHISTKQTGNSTAIPIIYLQKQPGNSMAIPISI
jgi:hypothetical protein